MQRRLTNSDGWIGPHPINKQIVRPFVGCDHTNVVEACSAGIDTAQLSRSTVRLNRPNGGLRVPMSEHDGDGAIASTDIDQVLIGDLRCRTFSKEQFGTGIDPVTGEHAAVCGEPSTEILQVEVHRLRLGFRRRVFGEVVACRCGLRPFAGHKATR